MTEQGDDDRAGRPRLSRGTDTEQGDDDRVGGRRQSRGTMTEQGNDDRTWDDDRAEERIESREATTM